MKSSPTSLLITIALLAGVTGHLLFVGHGERSRGPLEPGPDRAQAPNTTSSQELGASLLATLTDLPEATPRRSVVDGAMPLQAIREPRPDLGGVLRAFGTAKLAYDWAASHQLGKAEMGLLDRILEEDLSSRVSIATERKELPTPKELDFAVADITGLRDAHRSLDEARRQVIQRRDAQLWKLLGEECFQDLNQQVGSRIGR